MCMSCRCEATARKADPAFFATFRSDVLLEVTPARLIAGVTSPCSEGGSPAPASTEKYFCGETEYSDVPNSYSTGEGRHRDPIFNAGTSDIRSEDPILEP